MGPPASHRVTRVPWYSGYCYVTRYFAYKTVTSSGVASQPTSAIPYESHAQSATPKILLLSVWPLSFSLAATKKIDFSFSSSAYLDVSVQRVFLRTPIYSVHGDWVLPSRVPPFGNLRIYTYLRFPVAYRSLSRPSSAPNAKASALCSY